jgi:hypothetical protein
MKRLLKWTGLSAMVLLGATAVAADHGDGPGTAVESAGGDIADVYAWVNDDNSKVVMIQTITGEFSDAVQYVFHANRQDALATALTVAPSAPTDVICTFDGGPTKTSCWVGSDTYVTGDASDTLMGDGIKVHAGEHADPFFMYFTGFVNTVTEFNHLATVVLPTIMNPGPINAAGCVTPAVMALTGQFPGESTLSVSGGLLGLLNGTFAGEGPSGANYSDAGPTNTFAGANVRALVIEVDVAKLAGTGDFMQVWASTHKKP